MSFLFFVRPQDSATVGYALVSSSAFVDEGMSVTITLTTANVLPGTLVPYTITGISVEDLVSGSLTGNFTVGSGNTAELVLNFAEDELTEGQEIMTITLDNNPATTVSVTVNDTSTGGTVTTWAVTSLIDGTDDVTITDNGKMYILSNQGFLIESSDDGITWDKIMNIPSDINGLSTSGAASVKAFGNTLVVGTSGEVAVSSDGGITWSAASANSGSTGSINTIATNDTSSVYIVGTIAGRIARSTSLTGPWTRVDTPATDAINSLVYHSPSSTFVGVTASGQIVRSSNDGVSWTASASGVTTALHYVGVSAATGRLVAAGASGVIRTSVNGGVNWTALTSGITTTIVRGFYSAALDTFYFTNSTSRTIVTVTGSGVVGSISIPAEISISSTTRGICGNEGTRRMFVGSGSTSSYHARFSYADPNPLVTSGWTGRGFVSESSLGTSGAWDGSQFIVPLRTGLIVSPSGDLNTWSYRTTGSTTGLCIRHNGSQYVLGSSSTTIRYSSDGITWTIATGSPSGIQDFLWTGTHWIACGTDRRVFTSTDGITWTARLAELAGVTLWKIIQVGTSEFHILRSDGGVLRRTSSLATASWTSFAWTAGGATVTQDLHGGFVHPGTGKLVYFGDNRIYVNTGTTGTTFAAAYNPPGSVSSQSSGGVDHTGAAVVAGRNFIARSTDLVNWTVEKRSIQIVTGFAAGGTSSIITGRFGTIEKSPY
jgi:hypothetical protein